MNFQLESAVPILARTPDVVATLLRDLPAEWTSGTEGPDTWSPFDVVGHLIHADRADWIPRVNHLLTKGEGVPFPAFDRLAQAESSKGKSLPQMLREFRELRAESLRQLAALNLTPAHLERAGTHPVFGRVTLRQLLATWVAHDLDHIVQIARVMGRQYAEAVGPWREYLRIIKEMPARME